MDLNELYKAKNELTLFENIQIKAVFTSNDNIASITNRISYLFYINKTQFDPNELAKMIITEIDAWVNTNQLARPVETKSYIESYFKSELDYQNTLFIKYFLDKHLYNPPPINTVTVTTLPAVVSTNPEATPVVAGTVVPVNKSSVVTVSKPIDIPVATITSSQPITSDYQIKRSYDKQAIERYQGMNNASKRVNFYEKSLYKRHVDMKDENDNDSLDSLRYKNYI